MIIRKAVPSDIRGIAGIYAACFPRELNHELWIRSGFNAYPKGVYYVLSVDDKLCGYILWCAKNGFRSRTIIELEQIGIHPDFTGKGLGKRLIEDTIDKFSEHIHALGHDVGAILVTTSEGHFAERLYRSTLGVSRVAAISEYGSGTELILFNSRVA